MSRKRVAIISGGPSSEYDVSLRTGNMVEKYLDSKQYVGEKVRIDRKGKWFFCGGVSGKRTGEALKELKRRKYDVAFIAMHGSFGEDGTIQALFESIGLAYTGSGVLASALAMEKGKTNVFARSEGLLVPDFLSFHNDEWKKTRKDILAEVNRVCGFPAVIKPLCGGSSVGVSLVKNPRHLAAAVEKIFEDGDQVLAQAYILGVEFTCGVVEDKQGRPFALPPTKILPQAQTFYNYQAKYKTGGSIHEVPAKMTEHNTKQIQAFALKIHQALGCCGMSRSDFILKDNLFYYLETNTIPGMTQTSLLPEAAAAVGISFPELLDHIIRSALRPHRKFV